MSALEDALRGVVGDAHVLTDDDLKASYETDWTRRFHGTARCVVRPADTAQVAAVLRACAGAGVAVTVQGGNTGLVGGGVPAGGEVLLSLSRLTALEPVDTLAAQVTVGAGVTLEALQNHARAAGLDFGVDLAARSQASVGGLVATNAGGIRVVRYGSTRAQVVGVEAVLADGTVLSRLDPPAKDNTGYDLTQLLCGSEGTLAVITRVRVRLVPPAGEAAVALVGVDGTEGALRLLADARAKLTTLAAAELCYAEGVSLVRSVGRLPAPLSEDFPAYVVIECTGRTDPTDELVEMLGECEAVGDAAVASDAAGRAKLWAYRETHTEAISATGVPVKLDICVPLDRLTALVDELPGVIAAVAPDARTILFGHLNEGNLHVNVLGAEAVGEKVTDEVLRLVAAHRGSISSEHGVGRAKTPWLDLSRSTEEIEAMRRVKAAFDPEGRLNPGVLLPAR
ncbi:FAD-binding oxidoreductase [Luedemannella helvata]|uniref:FAD-binding oxidoreductase n=1 Tax=Luedemannella helvata TaxID=349315 RepID=A0ABP4W1V0_9ACTN